MLCSFEHNVVQGLKFNYALEGMGVYTSAYLLPWKRHGNNISISCQA